MIKKFMLLLLLLISTSIFSQPITIIVPFSAGGAFDKVAREYGNYIEEELKSPVNIVNVAGAGGWLGVLKLEQSGPRTIMLTSSSFYIHLNEKQVPLSNYKFVSVIADSPMYLIVSNNKITCEAIRNQNSPIFFGTSGRDSVTSMPIYFISKKYKNTVEVPYKGQSQAMVDLLGDRLTGIMISGLSSNRSGLPVIASTSDKTENGIPTFKDCLGINKTLHTQFLVAANLSADTEFVKQLNSIADKFTKDSITKEFFKVSGMRSRSGDLAYTEKLVRDEYNNWKSLLVEY